MISTRQLFFIINLVFFFVNPAASGDRNSSTSDEEAGLSYEAAGPSQIRAPGPSFRITDQFNSGLSKCFQFLFFGKELNNNDENIITKEVKKQNLKFCKMELFVGFQKETAFENFLYAFFYIKKADFEKRRSIYTYATAEYYYDLLCTAHEMNKPYLMGPQEYCEDRYENEEDNCLSDISKIGCEANDDGIICVKNLYFSLNKDEISVSHLLHPFYGTEDISDEDLEKAVNRGKELYSDLPYQELFKRLSDRRITRAYYKSLLNDDDPRLQYHLNDCNEELKLYARYAKEYDYDCVEDPYHFDPRRQFPFNTDEEINPVDSDEDREPHHVDPRYRRFRMYDLDGNYVHENYYLEEARNSFYGIGNISYEYLYRERYRRYKLHRKYAYQYVTYLHEQLQQGDSTRFKDRKQFCKVFLSNNPKYYATLDLTA